MERTPNSSSTDASKSHISTQNSNDEAASVFCFLLARALKAEPARATLAQGYAQFFADRRSP
jgi:hypothetical protein